MGASATICKALAGFRGEGKAGRGDAAYGAPLANEPNVPFGSALIPAPFAVKPQRGIAGASCWEGQHAHVVGGHDLRLRRARRNAMGTSVYLPRLFAAEWPSLGWRLALLGNMARLICTDTPVSP